MKCLEQINQYRQKTDQWLPGAGQEKGLTGNRHEKTSWDDGNIQCGNGCKTRNLLKVNKLI